MLGILLAFDYLESRAQLVYAGPALFGWRALGLAYLHRNPFVFLEELTDDDWHLAK